MNAFFSFKTLKYVITRLVSVYFASKIPVYKKKSHQPCEQVQHVLLTAGYLKKRTK